MESNKRPVPTGHVFKDIEAFQKYFGFNKVDVKYSFLVNQVEFLKEELDETVQALKDLNEEDFIDGLVDLIVVAAGTLAFTTGYIDDHWKEVMAANLKKRVGFNSKRQNSGGIDLIKPKGWTPPNHYDFKGKLQQIFKNTEPHEIEKHFPNKEKRECVKVLEDAAELLKRKSQDYVNPLSSVSPADYYPNGSDDFVYMIDVLKRHRQTSLLDAARNSGPDYVPNHESLEDTLLDRINYLALWVEWLRKKTPGQDPALDQFNRRQENDPK